jgi:hypothetical protein
MTHLHVHVVGEAMEQSARSHSTLFATAAVQA